MQRLKLQVYISVQQWYGSSSGSIKNQKHQKYTGLIPCVWCGSGAEFLAEQFIFSMYSVFAVTTAIATLVPHATTPLIWNHIFGWKHFLTG